MCERIASVYLRTKKTYRWGLSVSQRVLLKNPGCVHCRTLEQERVVETLLLNLWKLENLDESPHLFRDLWKGQDTICIS